MADRMRAEESTLDRRFPILGWAGIVTGAGRGIGRAVAVTLAGAGADLVVNDINEEGLSETARLVEERGRRVVEAPGDVAEVDLVASLPSLAVTELGRLDFVVNNAAAFLPRPFLDLDLEAFTAVFEVNTRAAFVLTQAAARHWVGTGNSGSVVNISSVSASFAQPRQAHYGASKAAIERMSRNIALEMGPYGIRVNCIAPGGPIYSDYVQEIMELPEYADYAALRPPLGRLGDPGEIGNAALFLVSNESSYVTGVVLTVDGGLTLGRSYRVEVSSDEDDGGRRAAEGVARRASGSAS